MVMNCEESVDQMSKVYYLSIVVLSIGWCRSSNYDVDPEIEIHFHCPFVPILIHCTKTSNVTSLLHPG